MQIREAIQTALPNHRGLFYAAMEKAERADDLDKVDQIFAQACDKADALFDEIDSKYPENEWAAVDIIDEIVEWVTESPKGER